MIIIGINTAISNVSIIHLIVLVTMRVIHAISTRLCRIVEQGGDSLRFAWTVPLCTSSSLEMRTRIIHSNIYLQESHKDTEVDVFTKKLQHKTERELEQLVTQQTSQSDSCEQVDPSDQNKDGVQEIGGPKGPEPTRYGDWERAGRCSDF